MALGILPDQRPRMYGLGQTPNYKPGDLIEDEVIVYNDIIGMDLVKLDMSYIPAGTFMMGSTESDTVSRNNEYPQHQVTITKPMLVLRTPVTQKQWQAVMGNNLASFIGEKRPVEFVSWDKAVEFCGVLSGAAGLYDDDAYRLLTEAEWEYACRAGTTTSRYGPINEVAWYKDNSGGRTHPVGQKLPNAWNLYDMLGNVWEWTNDWLGNYEANPQIDPKGPSIGKSRVVRGGSWFDDAIFDRAASRYGDYQYYRDFNLGFRICRTLNT
jgi:formylglycine-generating enzyme required for sulfatase activity